MKGDKMFELYSKFVGDNEEEIIDDFCNKVKRDLIGDLTLDEYSRFRFWKDYSNKALREMFRRYRIDTKDDMSYNTFCDLMWKTLDENIPEEMKDIMHSIKGKQIGEA